MSCSVAIIGGGITGLSAAFHLSRALPTASIHILEKSDRLGGWLNSTPVSTTGLALEAGPRTLRPNSLAIKELVSRDPSYHYNILRC